MDELKIFTGNAHPELARNVVDYLGIPLGKCEVFQFTNENIFVRILENVRSRDTFVIQPLASPVNQHLVELLIMLDALKRASAERITAVIPYYAYGRSDRKDQPRIPITARLLADLLTVAGANRFLTVDLHSAQIQGFFNIPVDELTGMYLLVDYFKKKSFGDDLVVVAADIGISRRARDVADRLHSPLAIMEKRRPGNDGRTRIMTVIGEVKNKVALIVDDEIDTAGTLSNNVDALIERGVKEVYFCATHAVCSGQAIERIIKSPVKEVVVTDTLPITKNKIDKFTVLNIAPVLGEAIHRIHTGQSIGEMFNSGKQ